MKLQAFAVVLSLMGCHQPAPQSPHGAKRAPPALSIVPSSAVAKSAVHADPAVQADPAGVRRSAPPTLATPAPAEPTPPPPEVERTTLRLRGGLHSPLPGGYMTGYQADTELDIAGFRLPVYAVAAGTLDYSEPGHTAWAGSDDKAVRLALDEPIGYGSRLITHVWYAHLYELTYLQEEGAEERIRVVAGERLGTSGIANGSPHLHLGFLLDNRVRQHWGTYLLEDEIREVLGGYRVKERLPPEPPPRPRGRARP